MAEQVAKMVIKVDLQCCRCYKKIKKILCEIPHVKDQSFDEKQNKVTITVVCCSPENVRQKILYKGRCFVEGVDILPEQKPKVDPPKKDDEKKGKEEKKEKQTNPSPPVLGYPPVYVVGLVTVCPPCHNRGCGWSCPCSCHCGWPPMCVDGCGRPAHECRCRRPPLCRDGCGKPPPECRCRKPSYPRCCDRCNNENACSSWTPCGCDCGTPPVCTNAGYECESSCSHM